MMKQGTKREEGMFLKRYTWCLLREEHKEKQKKVRITEKVDKWMNVSGKKVEGNHISSSNVFLKLRLRSYSESERGLVGVLR